MLIYYCYKITVISFSTFIPGTVCLTVHVVMVTSLLQSPQNKSSKIIISESKYNKYNIILEKALNPQIDEQND